MRKVLRRLRRAGRYMVRKHVLRNADAFDEWFHDHGDETLSIRHDLNEESIVFEVGGYEGRWSAEMIARYNPVMHIFEPVEAFYAALSTRLKNCEKAHAYNFGLSDRDETVELNLSADGSSRFGTGQQRQRIELKDIYCFVREKNINQIDLIQINIEGSEYQLLRRMLDTQLTRRCRIIQVQFHRNVPDAELNRQQIRERLAETHDLLYDYPFVWEAWRLKARLLPGAAEWQ